MMIKKKQRILVVEDEVDVREFVLLHLKREGYAAVGAASGEEALALLDQGSCDLAILDWMLPGMTGLELCRRLTGQLPILMVTARAENTDIVLGLSSGADDYVVKPFEIPILMARVGALLRRAGAIAAGATTSSARYEVQGLRLDLDAHEVVCEGEQVDLTPSEFKVLVALMQNQGKVMTRDKLIESVQGEGVFVGDRTIDTHVFGLRKKLGKCAEVVETIRGVGYRVQA